MMKKLLTVLITAATMVGAMAEVPSLINYQGKLSDKDGAPVNGDKNFTVRIFDANEGGKQVYEEAIGAVSVKDGLYSFGFGEAGQSVATTTEIVGSTDGSAQIFNHTAANIPIVGDVKITAGDYSWTDTGGSSSTSQFTATANQESGQVSAIFISGAPAAGTKITVAYDYHSTGIMGALSENSRSWLEITIGGETLSPRERLVSVPFAIASIYSTKVLENKIFHPLFTFSDSSEINKVLYPPFHAPTRQAGGGTWRYVGTRSAYLPHLPQSGKVKLFYKLSNLEDSDYCSLIIDRLNLETGKVKKIFDIYPRKKGSKDEVVESNFTLNTKDWDFRNYRYILRFSSAADFQLQSAILHYIYVMSSD